MLVVLAGQSEVDTIGATFSNPMREVQVHTLMDLTYQSPPALWTHPDLAQHKILSLTSAMYQDHQLVLQMCAMLPANSPIPAPIGITPGKDFDMRSFKVIFFTCVNEYLF